MGASDNRLSVLSGVAVGTSLDDVGGYFTNGHVQCLPNDDANHFLRCILGSPWSHIHVSLDKPQPRKNPSACTIDKINNWWDNDEEHYE